MEWISFALVVLAGAVLLFAGRKFFWAAAGLVVFVFVFSLFDNLFNIGWFGIIIAIVLGAICAWLATKFVRLIGYLFGALAGAAGLPILLGLLGIDLGWMITALIGALIGFLIIRMAFDWGLIFLTAWAGSNVIVDQVGKMWTLGATVALIILAVLLVAGIAVQATALRAKK